MITNFELFDFDLEISKSTLLLLNPFTSTKEFENIKVIVRLTETREFQSPTQLEELKNTELGSLMRVIIIILTIRQIGFGSTHFSITRFNKFI
jgi:hypothetical protein